MVFPQFTLCNTNLNSSAGNAQAAVFPPPPQYSRVTVHSVPAEIGLVRSFLLKKLEAHNNEPLVEDLELPVKQRPNQGRPRLPATGKIGGDGPKSTNISPLKRPPPKASQNSQGGEPSKKKKKNNDGKAQPAIEINGAPQDAPVVNGNVTIEKKGSATKLDKLKSNLPAGEGKANEEGSPTANRSAAAAGEGGGGGAPGTEGREVNGTGPVKVNGVASNGDESAMMSPESL